jgi:hypothetical protein
MVGGSRRSEDQGPTAEGHLAGVATGARPAILERSKLVEVDRMVITQRFRTTAPQVGHVTEPVLELTEARLDLRLDAARLEVRSADLGSVLIEYAGHRPVLAVDRATGRVRARRSHSWLGAAPPPDIDALLNSRLPWTVRARGAGMSGRLDLRRLGLGGLDLAARDGRFRADLPAPDGAVLVRLGGRGAAATLTVPAGTCVRFWQQHGWVVEGHRSEGPVALDRYDVWLDGGAGRCRVDTRAADPTAGAVPRLRVLF